MRLLIASKNALDPRKGAPQTLIALGGELERLGHDVAYVDPPTLGTDEAGFPEAFRGHLLRHAARYDAVDYDYRSLPARREELPDDVLLVARVQLLPAGVAALDWPPLPRLRSRVAAVLRRRSRAVRRTANARADDARLREADLVVILNTRDRARLIERGLPPEKVVAIANGLGSEVVADLEALPTAVPDGPPRLAFVGMYSPRKGGGDFPRLVARLAERVPEVRVRLIGTGGILKTADEVTALFPRRLRDRLEVVPRYRREELAGLLAPCWAGVFPSYHEGFMLAVIEMLTAALPVVAYDAPGASDALPPERLVPPGDAEAAADRLAALLTDRAALAEARRAARERAQPYRWPIVAEQTAAIYADALERLRATPQPATS